MTSLEGEQQGAQGSTAPTPPTAPEKPKTPPTKYVVLEQHVNNSEQFWTASGIYEARSARAAVAMHVANTAVEGGTFIAVPARSWEPIVVKTETQTRLKFS